MQLRGPQRRSFTNEEVRHFFLLVVLGGIGTTAALAAAGIVDIPLFSNRNRLPVGWVPVPTAGRTVPVYGLVQPRRLERPCDGTLERGLVAERISGPRYDHRSDQDHRPRVESRKRGQFCLQESDFLPPGTRFGMVAGIPLGKRSVVCEAKKIGGIHALQKGDRFDLVVTIPAQRTMLR